MARPAWVVPARRLRRAARRRCAVTAGAQLLRHRVARGRGRTGRVVRRRRHRGAGRRRRRRGALRRPAPRSGLAARAAGRRDPWLRPDAAGAGGRQVIVYGGAPPPSYAWAFDRGDGLFNVGYGELLDADRRRPRGALLEQLEALLPGATDGGDRLGGSPAAAVGRALAAARRAGAAGRRRRRAGQPDDRRGHLLRRRHRCCRPGRRRGDRRGRARTRPEPCTRGRPRRCSAATCGTSASPDGCRRSGAVLDAGLRAAGRRPARLRRPRRARTGRGRITPRLVGGLAATSPTGRPSRTAPRTARPAPIDEETRMEILSVRGVLPEHRYTQAGDHRRVRARDRSAGASTSGCCGGSTPTPGSSGGTWRCRWTEYAALDDFGRGQRRVHRGRRGARRAGASPTR